MGRHHISLHTVNAELSFPKQQIIQDLSFSLGNSRIYDLHPSRHNAFSKAFTLIHGLFYFQFNRTKDAINGGIALVYELYRNR